MTDLLIYFAAAFTGYIIAVYAIVWVLWEFTKIFIALVKAVINIV
jgi:hypothetical protein